MPGPADEAEAALSRAGPPKPPPTQVPPAGKTPPQTPAGPAPIPQTAAFGSSPPSLRPVRPARIGHRAPPHAIIAY